MTVITTRGNGLVFRTEGTVAQSLKEPSDSTREKEAHLKLPGGGLDKDYCWSARRQKGILVGEGIVHHKQVIWDGSVLVLLFFVVIWVE